MAARLLILSVAGLLIAGAAAAGTLEAAAGRALFERNWISAPASLAGNTGLGPHYDARACSACHPQAGPGAAGPAAVGAGMAVRLGDAHGKADVTYGAQLQTKAVFGANPEARAELVWLGHALGRRPVLETASLAYGPLSTGVRSSLRRAPALWGLGLIEDVPAAEIQRRADPTDRDRDGVSGRISWTLSRSGHRVAGRWGWKAAQPELEQQVRTSLVRDIGVTTEGAPSEETPAELARDQPAAPQGPGADAPPEVLSTLVAYLRALPAPPSPDRHSPGYLIFQRAGCGACHAVLHTASGRPVAAYTDLLLHDMGRGLDDGVGEGGALSQEWRTAPLWTIAAELRSGGLLHDGRARTIAEAVGWHGGEAARSRRRFESLRAEQQRAVAAFLGGW